MVRALGFFNSHAAGGGINWCFSGEQFDITFQVKKKKKICLSGNSTLKNSFIEINLKFIQIKIVSCSIVNRIKT